VPFVLRMAALASAFVVPLSAAIVTQLGASTFAEQRVRTEIRGAACFPAVYGTLHALDTYRSSASPAAAALVERAFERVDSVGCAGFGPDQWSQIRRTWPEARRNVRTLEDLAEQVVEYEQVVSDLSNLTYDSNRAVIELEDALAYRLPGVTSRLTLAATTADPVATAKLEAAAADRLHFAQDDIAQALAEHEEFEGPLRGPAAQAYDAELAYLGTLDRWERVAPHGGAEWAERTSQMREAIGAIDRLLAVGDRELLHVLEEKLAGVLQRRRVELTLSEAAVFISSAIVLAIAATIVRRDRRRLARAEQQAALLQAELARGEAEDSLRVNEERFRTIFAGSPLAIAITDLRGRVTECNDAYLELVGGQISVAGTLLLDPLRVESPSDLEAIFETLRKGSENVRTGEFALSGRGGRRTWCHVIVSAVRSTNGAPSYCTVMLQDVTERDRRAFVVTLSAGIVVDDGRYAKASTAIGDAEFAMYQAKAQGGDRTVPFDAAQRDDVPRSA
jgi:PAS domain S-box-containing protein